MEIHSQLNNSLTAYTYSPFNNLRKQHASLNQLYNSASVTYNESENFIQGLTKHLRFITNDLVIITWEIAAQPFFLRLLLFSDSCLLLSSFRQFPESTVDISNPHIPATFFQSVAIASHA